MRILILSVSAGAGHTRAAEAIRAHADLHQAEVTASHLDVMNYVPASFRKCYTDFYIRLVSRHPAVWGYLYQRTHDARPNGFMERLRRAIERLNTKALRRKITELQPDAIVCTHFLPAEILAHMVRTPGFACPVWVQVTDFDLHRLWVQQGMAGYFVATDEVAYRLRVQGIAPDTIHVTGIPIAPAFSDNHDRARCAAEYGLNKDKMTILLMGGGAGLGNLDTLAAQLLAMDGGFQLVVLTGKNADAQRELQKLALRHPQHLFPQSFTHTVERLMACADLVITKPGGLTTSECLAMGLPMIVNGPIPGQEERNADYLLEQGVALKAVDVITLTYRIEQLIDHPATLGAMRRRACELGRPFAGTAVIDAVLHSHIA
ncbi:MAG: galactosyldiacylglycerol synthase [Herminiimonas sp.]|nr:galactosyldiacylglycerol synthase [Herminiimonas sp.]